MAYSAHALIENHHGLLVDFQMDEADGRAERRNAIELIDARLPGDARITVGGDKGFDTRDFVSDCRARNVTPHVAQNITKQRRSAVDARTTCQPGYAISRTRRSARSTVSTSALFGTGFIACAVAPSTARSRVARPGCCRFALRQRAQSTRRPSSSWSSAMRSCGCAAGLARHTSRSW